MEAEAGDSFFSSTSDGLVDESNLLSDPEFDACLKIIQKPVSSRTVDDAEYLVKKIISLDIFKKSVLDNLNAKTILTKLAPYMYYEYFPANSVLSEYDNDCEKFSIILQGRAKEFVSKTLLEIEKEADECSKEIKRQRKSTITPLMTESTIPASLTSLGRDDDCNSQIPTMNTLGDKEYNSSTAAKSKDKFVKINSVLPSLRRMSTVKWKSENLDEAKCQKALTKMKTVINSMNLDGVLEADFAEKQIDHHVLNEFKKNEKNLFLGGILKLKFSKFLCMGDHFGLNVLKGETVANKAVIATEDCHCLTLSREDYFRVVDYEKELNKDKIEFFQRYFEGEFHPRSLAEFALLWENQSCQMNHVIFQQNEPSGALHVLVSGEVVISKNVDPTSKKPNAIEEMPLRRKRRQDSNANLVKLVTVCGGNFFGEEDFFNGKRRQFTATVSSTRAKVFRLSIENYKTAQKDYKDIIGEIEGLVRAKKKFEKERLQYLSQQKESTQQAAEQFLRKKNQVIQMDYSSVKDTSTEMPKKFIVYKKEKPVNVRFEYDKLFVPKPEKMNPVYYAITTEEKSKSLAPTHKNLTPSRGTIFIPFRSEEFENSVEDQRSDYLPSMTNTEIKRTTTDINRRKDEKGFQQNMKKILDEHLNLSRRQKMRKQAGSDYNTLTENSMKTSTKFFNPDEDSTVRTTKANKSITNGVLRLESDASIGALSSNSIMTGGRSRRRGASGSKNPVSEILHFLPLSVRATVHHPNVSMSQDPLRIMSVKGSVKPKIENKKEYTGIASLLSEKIQRASVKILKSDYTCDDLTKSEVAGVNVQENKENGMETPKARGTISRKSVAKLVLSRSRSSNVKKM